MRPRARSAAAKPGEPSPGRIEVSRLVAPLLVLVSLSIVSACGPAPSVTPEPGSTKAADADDEDEASAAVRARLEAILAEDPKAGGVLYVLARADANTGETEAALERLEQLAALPEWDYTLELADFGELADHPRLQAVARTLAARAPELEHGPVALELDRVDILPEGLAWDPRRGELLLGSMRQRAVLAADAEGHTRELVAPRSEGLLAVLGMDVDVERDQLWVAATSAPFMADYDEASAGLSGVWGFELATGAPLAVVMAPQRPAQLNDLVVLADGRVVVTDSLNGSVLVRAPGGERLEQLVAEHTLLGANGIVAAESEDAVYVADFRGIHRVPLDGGALELLLPPAAVATLGGIDGLARQGNTLVGIQNLWCRGRVWALTLDDTGRGFTGARILDDDHPRMAGPTTGVFVGEGRFWYLANAAMQFEGGQLREAEADERHLILELAL